MANEKTPEAPISGAFPTPLARVIDLDAYRASRIAEGTWPPDEKTVRDYWRPRRPKKKPDYDKVAEPSGSAGKPENEPPEPGGAA